jgi:hypothetical protein
MLYKLTNTFSDVSYSRITVNVVDNANFNSPSVIPVDPRASSVALPQIHIDESSAVLMCLDQIESATSTTTISSPTISISHSGNLISGVSTTTADNVRTYSGSSTVVRDQSANIIISAISGTLIRNGLSKYLRVRVTGTGDGISNCANGTSRVIELRPFIIEFIEQLRVVLD